ncbi:MAG: hypothetical protein ACOYOQ_08000 [Microthrixaceae bacterium]
MTRSRPARRGAAGLLVALALVAGSGCVPTRAESAREIDDGSGFAPSGRPAPVFPSSGPVPVELLVSGIVFDLTDAPADRNLWVPDEAQATCAARSIVDSIGSTRLSELGYRPGTDGNGLNQVALTAAERRTVAERFAACVDLSDAVGTILMGNDQMSGAQADCIAEQLRERDLLIVFADAWAFAENVDPFGGDGQLAEALLTASQACLGEDAFDWLDADLPGSSEGTVPGPTTTVPGTPDGLANRTGSAGTRP